MTSKDCLVQNQWRMEIPDDNEAMFSHNVIVLDASILNAAPRPSN